MQILEKDCGNDVQLLVTAQMSLRWQEGVVERMRNSIELWVNKNDTI